MDPIDLPTIIQEGVRLLEAMPASQFLTLLALPIVLTLSAIEWLHFRQSDKFALKDSAASIMMGGAYILLAEGVMVLAFVIPAFNWLYQFRLFSIEITPLSFIALFLLVDLLFYLFHLAAHRIRFLWGVHEVHHGSEYFNFTVAFRQSVLYAVVGVYIFFVPAVIIGFPPEWVLGTLAVNLLYQILAHTQWVGRLPAPIEWLFNTPSNHRVHHGRNPRYVDRNMGGVFMIWDHIFGTYTAEDPAEPPEYGVISQIGKEPSYNPVTLTLREYVSMFKDVLRPGPLAQRLKHLWAPPEWQRPGSDTLPGSAARGQVSGTEHHKDNAPAAA